MDRTHNTNGLRRRVFTIMVRAEEAKWDSIADMTVLDESSVVVAAGLREVTSARSRALISMQMEKWSVSAQRSTTIPPSSSAP